MNENEVLRDDEISLGDMVMSLIENWRKIGACALLGVLVGFGGWYQQGYQVELTANTRNTSSFSLDFLTWRTLLSGLPGLANKLAVNPHTDSEAIHFYKKLSQAEWWRKNVTPVYMYSKSDVKELASISREALDAGTTTIERIQIRTTGSSRETALEEASKVETLIRDGAVYLALKSMLNRYDQEVREVPARLLPMMSKAEVELIYLNQKADALESLRKNFPDHAGAVIQSVMDPKDSGAKYLPLVTQLVATKTEIDTTQESLTRWRDRLEQLSVTTAFLEKAMPLLERETDGFVLSAQLSEVEKDLRKATLVSNKQKALALNTIAGDIEIISTRYGKLFESHPLASVRRPPLGLPVVLGLIGGTLIGVLFVFGMRAFRRWEQPVVPLGSS